VREKPSFTRLHQKGTAPHVVFIEPTTTIKYVTTNRSLPDYPTSLRTTGNDSALIAVARSPLHQIQDGGPNVTRAISTSVAMAGTGCPITAETN
jgi:hypothetical protein